ncbi:MAG: DUF480 domain-containing protein [Zetaproteobacteria bacterium CG_4_9_14_3_um_filter_49_83]|nr:MAG: hypothetical protein AUJ56_07455 [Zetaproteobacteria bacterium CG1_02_49_23]PIQ30410.1 MAG: DUF480 domain-containing protein [Zetaproteobacteria bacterium CG17_big_fil_post_rev_8_21_14_2_50_50_13]PIV29968.1 MAG: DUF480 domain-containing protein [Zetaproteobacteria bacterium CG02_land_8_20_14_3_00_50_9]PIY56526.1 MAG: DUF480 domain-containing protein [Zetaproteobacteria bacterium CG_4_10_14_0_8_um_filter_49_80]PJA35242.1 MAG: DUF480 domain-containing protein [Zetaproteobacteria bacterium
MSDFASYDYDPEEAFLTDVEARVIGSLMEKQMTTPDYYPLTANALIAACNQKSSRDPVMDLTRDEIGHTLQALRGRGLVTANTLSRADRFEQQLSRKFSLKTKERAVLCVMLLRGAQTLNEIRTRTERMVNFEDNDAVHEALQGLIQLEAPLVMLIAKGPGQREDRYTHLLSGQPDIEMCVARSAGTSTRMDMAERMEQLEQEVALLREELQLLWLKTGLNKDAVDED